MIDHPFFEIAADMEEIRTVRIDDNLASYFERDVAIRDLYQNYDVFFRIACLDGDVYVVIKKEEIELR